MVLFCQRLLYCIQRPKEVRTNVYEKYFESSIMYLIGRMTKKSEIRQ